ncbi:uncharacterized protein [Euphorbia lathyris]|uniref:uncharacterized protein n=1 Tax=Euphorbia lathyris TaxID=212925 RepID=UPI003314423B
MEGGVSEELKSRAAASQGSSKRRRVKKKLASRMQCGGDASHGQMGVGSESHLVKCKRIKKKRVSRLQRGPDASKGNMAGGSDGHQVNRKRVEEESFSWFQRGASEGDTAGGSNCHQVKRKRLKDGSFSGLPRAIDATQRQIDGGSARGRLRGTTVTSPSLVAILKEVNLGYAKMALEFYEKSQDAEFEVLEVLDVSGSRLQLPEAEDDQYWIHISFICKRKNADCSDVSPKHFFGELLKDDCSGKFHATCCSTFEPSDDPGFDHGCIFCLPDQKFHPTDGYCVGRPPWYIPKVVYGHPPWLYDESGTCLIK